MPPLEELLERDDVLAELVVLAALVVDPVVLAAELVVDPVERPKPPDDTALLGLRDWNDFWVAVGLLILDVMPLLAVLPALGLLSPALDVVLAEEALVTVLPDLIVLVRWV